MTKRVTHLIAGLGLGGAETMLYQLLAHRKDSSIIHRVISLGAETYYEEPIRNLGIELLVFPFKKRPLKTINEIKEIIKDTDTLCCWMYYGNLIGEIAFRRYHKDESKKIIWNIRQSNLDKGNVKQAILFVNWLCAKMSKKIDIIAYNGNLARQVHESRKYCSEKGIVLENGCDISLYNPQKSAPEDLRKEIGITADKKIIISVAKDDPVKDIPSFIKAFSKVHNRHPETVAVMCGRGIVKDNERLVMLCKKAGLNIGSDVFPIGLRHDVPRLFSGCDLYVLHSAGEAFPNTLIQAMACEALCVTTDVGDAKRILNDSSLTACPKDPDDISDKIEVALSLSPEMQYEKRRCNRIRVIEKYDINSIVGQYESLY